MRYFLIVAAFPFVVAGCSEQDVEPLADRQLNLMVRSTEPFYQYGGDRKIRSTSCLSKKHSTYSSAPSACVVDTVFAHQAANPRDLVAPGPAGRSYAGPNARAAYEYIHGTSPVRGAWQGGRSGAGAVIPVGGGGEGGGAQGGAQQSSSSGGG